MVSRVGRWAVGALVTVTAFGVAAWLAGAWILVPVIASSADRWVVASGLGVAVAALAALWGHSYATKEHEAPPQPAVGDSGKTAGEGGVENNTFIGPTAIQQGEHGRQFNRFEG